MTILVGLDIGGSKTHGIRFVDGEVAAEATVGSANVQNTSSDTAAAHLAKLFKEIGSGAAHVIAGAGGIDTPADARELEALIRPLAGNATIQVVHDSRLILAAGGTDSGIAVIAGTGSAAWGCDTQGREARFGGWGYLLGDEGSGYWLGREAVRHSLQRMNEHRPVDHLTELLLAGCGLTDPRQLIALFHSPQHSRHFWAGQARHVVTAASRGHEASNALLAQAGNSLAELTLAASRQLAISGPVVLGGGIGMNVEPVQTAFSTALAREGIAEVRILAQEPAMGALRLLQSKDAPDGSSIRQS